MASTPAQTTTLVQAQIVDNIGIITLKNEAKRNCLSSQLLEGVEAALDEFEANKIFVAILRAAPGAKVWSAGHDISELPVQRDPLGYADPLESTLRKIQTYPGPVICLVQGSVWGGACDIVMTSDIVIGDPTSTFAITPAKLGLPYNSTGILHFMNRLGINLAKEMFFSAEPVLAERAYQLGILNHLVPPEEIESFTSDLARRISSHSALSIAVIKEQFRLLSNAYPISPETFERIQDLRRKVYNSEDYAEGIRAFMEKRNPVFKGK